MAKTDQPTTIKKYANRRLYNTGTSTYVTLEDLAAMVKSGEDFLVYDAKTGDDITRTVLAQIIFEQENKAGQNLLPTTFLRQLIRFYGDSMQMVVPRYLEQSIDMLTREQEKYRKQLASTLRRSRSTSAATWKCSSGCSNRSCRRRRRGPARPKPGLRRKNPPTRPTISTTCAGR